MANRELMPSGSHFVNFNSRLFEHAFRIRIYENIIGRTLGKHLGEAPVARTSVLVARRKRVLLDLSIESRPFLGRVRFLAALARDILNARQGMDVNASGSVSYPKSDPLAMEIRVTGLKLLSIADHRIR